MTRTYRTGALGAMMDEYERAAAELTNLVKIVDARGFFVEYPQEAEKCRSIQRIMRHVVRAAYGYANDIRAALNMAVTGTLPTNLEDKYGSIVALESALNYTAAALEDKWAMSEDEIERVTMPTPWGTTYTLEQMLEHAIVHILRHRRQIERLIDNPI
jgi:uncharacterized damage-inducible protein DinB